jgi:hypothetical protein
MGMPARSWRTGPSHKECCRGLTRLRLKQGALQAHSAALATVALICRVFDGPSTRSARSGSRLRAQTPTERLNAEIELRNLAI